MHNNLTNGKIHPEGFERFYKPQFWLEYNLCHTQPTAEILSGKNAHTWVSMVYIWKNEWKLKYQNEKKNPGSRLLGRIGCAI